VIVIAATAITNVRVFDGERLREPATVVLEQATISARTSADGALRRGTARLAGAADPATRKGTTPAAAAHQRAG
jgi:hypothetical protein